MVKQRKQLASAIPVTFLPTDPIYLRLLSSVQMMNDPVAVKATELFVASVPPSDREDRTECAATLNGPLAESTFEAAIKVGMQDAKVDLDLADGELRAAREANDDLEKIISTRSALPSNLVQVGQLMISRQQNRDDLPILQRNAENRSLAGDRDHEDRAGGGLVGWIFALVIAIIEASFSSRIFNVDFKHVSVAVLTWSAITIALILFNHWIIKTAGALQRDYREIRKQNRLIAEQALGTIHGHSLGGPK